MAPNTKTKLKMKRSQEFAPSKGRRNVLADLESGHSDDEMQVATIPKEPEWEGFGQEEEESSEEEDDQEEGADERMDAEEAQPVIDESEEELERLVFGDSAGFRESVKGFSLNDSVGAGSDKEEEEGPELDEVPDQNMFFFDLGTGVVPPPLHAEEDEEGEKPAWDDSDDERFAVSLLDRQQNKKLRETEEEDVVGGKEYIRRLRKQYQSLYPTPDWATYATNKSKRKRTRATGNEEGESESGSDIDMDDADELSTQPLARLLRDADILDRNSREPAKRRKLQSGTINIRKLRGVAQNGPSSITSLSFHPTYPLLLSSGPSATLSLHHVKPEPPNPNPLLTSLHIKHTPLTTTAFHPSPSDSRVFLSARRRYFHVWDLATGTVEKVSRVYGHQHEQRTMENFSLSPDGRHMALRGSSVKGGGVINILDATTLQWVTQARIDSRGGIADFVWWGDGNGICIVGKNGEVTEWSLNEGVVGRWTDDGALGTTVIAVGGKSGRHWIGGDRWVAIGSTSGIVNIYDRRAWQESNTSNGTSSTKSDHNGGIPKAPTPVRVLDNLTTPISFIKFSPDGQVMAMASRWKSNALRLVHLPSATVYKNWPTQVTQIGRISAVAWGRPTEADEKEGSIALLSVANEMGKIRLWEVRA